MTSSGTESIGVTDLVKRFGGFTAVGGVSFSVVKGEIFGLLGPNGAGKSTVIRMLCGLIRPTSGRGQVAGHDLFTDPEGIKHRIGYMSQKFSLYEDLTPYENIRFYLGVYNVPVRAWRDKIEWVLDMTRLKEDRNRLTMELPPGLRQRLALGCALLHEPEILFLDEPTAGVDPLTRRHFWEFIRHLSGQGMTILVTTHYMDEAEHCDRIIMISDGLVVAGGTPAEIISGFAPGGEGGLNEAFVAIMRGGAD